MPARRTRPGRLAVGSTALADLLVGTAEIRAMREHPPHPARAVRHPIDRAQVAHRRACVVLLSSHYERFIYTLNEEAVGHVNQTRPKSTDVPLSIRLSACRSSIDQIAQTHWQRRGDGLTDFASSYAQLWDASATVSTISADTLLEYMKSPKNRDVVRFFSLYGVDNIFAKVTRTDSGRGRLWRSLDGLVDARNGIAHGDMTVQPVGSDITSYLDAVVTFCTRADRVLARRLQELFGGPLPW